MIFYVLKMFIKNPFNTEIMWIPNYANPTFV